VSLDSSVIDLSLSVFDWAKFRRTKGAVKLHLLLDHDGYLPSFAVVTDGKTSDIKVARRMRFDPGSVLIMDRGYIDYEWFVQLTQQAVYFVTRLKDRASFDIVEERPVPAKGNILKDQIIFFHSQPQPSEEYFFRLVEVWLEDKQESVIFLTNNLQFAAATIAAIYKDRWSVELFFKGDQTKPENQDVPRDQSQCRQNADMDGSDRHADFEVPSAPLQIFLVLVQSDCVAASSALCLSRPFHVAR
jgi:hypothetical protein